MTRRILPDEPQVDWMAEASVPDGSNLQSAQEVIYKFLKKLVDSSSPEIVLQEFKNLFIWGYSTDSAEEIQSLYQLLLNNNGQEFKNTLKRSCYILINNWSSRRNYHSIEELIQILPEVTAAPPAKSPSLKRLRAWVTDFINSEDYQELKLFASPYKNQEKSSWSHRYASYLLVPQYLDSQNPIEQRELARYLSRRLKEKFKLDLAIYTARCNSSQAKEKELSNPTQLGDGVIRLIRQIVSKATLFDYTNQAHIFLQQTRELTYKDFKQSLQNYLVFSFNHLNSLGILDAKLAEKLDKLYENHHSEKLNTDLLLRTCRQVIEWLTTEESHKPSDLFILLTTQESSLTLAIILLRIILICQYVRTHLEICIAKLIHFYEESPEHECQWFIKFLEVFNLVFAIYAENVQYNLVKVKENSSEHLHALDLDAYRVFSQLKGDDLRGNDLSDVDLRGADLSAADLRGASLHGTDLSQADLSLSKLSKVNLSSAILNGAELIATDLNHANLSSASLIATKLRRAYLRQANLSNAKLTHASLNASDLSGADLSYADLQYADLSDANLSNANLSGVNLQYANLSHANLSNANLSGTNLQYADLNHVKIDNANLSSANLQYANLSHANLQCAILTEANLSRTNLEQANLLGANLTGAMMRHALFTNANLSGANLSRTDLSHAEFRHANLMGVDLSGALLRHVNLNDANLSNANLRGANLFSTDLNSTKLKDAQFGNNSGL